MVRLLPTSDHTLPIPLPPKMVKEVKEVKALLKIDFKPAPTNFLPYPCRGQVEEKQITSTPPTPDK